MEKNDLKILEDTLCTWLHTAVGRGMEAVDADELGKLVDMVKDMAEAKKYCLESKYYESVTKAMEEGEDPKYGYSIPRKPYMDQEPYISAYMHDPNKFKDNMRYGYTDWSPSMGTGDERYGKSYHEYKNAKRHYTETNSATDKEMMNLHANEHLNDSLTTLRDIWKSADPELKKRMKADLMTLTSEMTV